MAILLALLLFVGTVAFSYYLERSPAPKAGADAAAKEASP